MPTPVNKGIVHRTVDIPDLTYSKLSVVSAAYGMSIAEVIRAFIDAGIKTCADNDRFIRGAFMFYDRYGNKPDKPLPDEIPLDLRR